MTRQIFDANDWFAMSGHPIAGRGLRPMRAPQRVKVAAKPAKQAIAAAKLRRKLALAVAIANAPRTPKPVRRYTLTASEYALATPRERTLSDAVIQRFHGPRPR